MNRTSSEIGVVHLIRASNGIEPFKRFLTSYKDNRGGIDHDLVIIYKGFRRQSHLAPYETMLSGIRHKTLQVADFGYDIRAYFRAAKRFSCRYYCFLNSFSVVRDKDWLRKLYDHASRPDVGLVGATGSYESAYSNALRQDLHHARFFQRIKGQLWTRVLGAYFDPFPNYHIRSNGFMLASSTLAKIRPGLILTKMDAHRFESGKQSLTKQVLTMNLKTLIIGKDGVAFDKEEWCNSMTFRQGSQTNLLIADNQTFAFDRADAELRQRLAKMAWDGSWGSAVDRWRRS